MLASFVLRKTTTAIGLALVATMVAVAVADARPARVSGDRIMDANKHEMKVRGVTWGGTRFVPNEAGVELRAPDVSTAPSAFKRIAMLGANVVRVDVSSAANDDVHRVALQKLQRYAHARGLILLLANVPLTTQDQSPWLSTLAGWFPRKDNVWYLPAVDPNCGTFSASTACGDTEAWIWTQTLSIKALRRAGVRTPIVVNLPDGSRSVALNWTTVLDDTNLVYGVHPSSDGQFRFKQSNANALTTSLEAATKVVPVLFDDVARVQTTTTVDTMVSATTARLKRTTRTTTDSLRWSQGLLDWVTGWTVIDGGDGAIVSGWDTPTRDSMSKGRKKLTTWGRAAASGYFAIGFRAQSGRNPGSDFPGGFKVGDSGPGVRALQEDLARLTYLAPRFVTGSYDDATWQAVVGFQGYSRLERNGVASALTVASLMRAERPQARHVEGVAHVEIDLNRQVMMLVHGSGVVTRLIHISSGITGNTPAGSFTVTRKERMSWSKPFKAWLPYASYFFEGFAMHEFPDVPEYAASHGCVRIAADDAAAVYAFTEMGMPVILYHSS
ncbi:MAG: hypothetical protein CK540_06940 [Thermoleophilia bacterium]|nr:MAG: hypothetical protein CK540_06940 [Thermoleophilia bacterium]